MKIRSINRPNINRLSNAFLDYLLESEVPFTKIGLVEGEENLALYLEIGEQPRIIKFKKEFCIGHEPTDVAESIITPLLDHLKGKKD